MATNFPGALDVLTNPVPTSDTVTVPHSTQHANANDSIEALEAKVGVNGSAVTTSHDYKLGEVTGTDKAVGKTATQVMTNKTLGSGSKVLVGSDATGDTYYNGGSGTVTRRAIGSEGQVYTVVSGVPAWQSPSAVNSNYIVDTGVANAYIADLVPALGAYAAGTRVEFKAVNANTTTSTVNVNGLGVKTIKKLGGSTDLASGDIAAGMIVELEYDGTNFVMLNPVANAPLTPTGNGSGLTGIISSATATASISGTGISTTQNIDTAVTVSGTAKTIIVNFWLKGFSGAGTPTYSMGTAYFDGTTIRSYFSPLYNTTSTAPTATTYTVGNTSPVAGGDASNGGWTMSIQSLTSTGFTFRLTYTQGSSFNGGDYKCNVVAIK